MKRSTASILFAICLTSLAVLGPVSHRRFGRVGIDLVPKAQAQSGEQDSNFMTGRTRPCTLGTLKGRYGFTFTGTLVSPPVPAAIAGPLASVGVATYNGDGTFSTVDTTSLNGMITTAATTGTYTVDADCTGSSTVTDSSGNTRHADFVILNHGEEIRTILTDPGRVVTGISKKY